jgi:hypothetical protein
MSSGIAVEVDPADLIDRSHHRDPGRGRVAGVTGIRFAGGIGGTTGQVVICRGVGDVRIGDIGAQIAADRRLAVRAVSRGQNRALSDAA